MEKIKTPFELFNVECGKGWFDLLRPIFEYIERYNKDEKNKEKIEVLQVKEKFGGLRFYTNFQTNELSKLIEEAEFKADNTCELCGSTEKVGKTLGWITTCCEECAKKIAKNNYSEYIRWIPNNKEEGLKWYEINKQGEIKPQHKEK